MVIINENIWFYIHELEFIFVIPYLIIQNDTNVDYYMIMNYLKYGCI